MEIFKLSSVYGNDTIDELSIDLAGNDIEINAITSDFVDVAKVGDQELQLSGRMTIEGERALLLAEALVKAVNLKTPNINVALMRYSIGPKIEGGDHE